MRRDATRWTLVQGVLAPIQFAVFLISAWLVCRYLISGEGYALATASVLVKTGALYLIMITGAIWEKEVFGQYLFARTFFWEDAVSMLVIALHTAYLLVLAFGGGDPAVEMRWALIAYVAYLINAAQYVWKLRRARLESSPSPTGAASGAATGAPTGATS